MGNSTSTLTSTSTSTENTTVSAGDTVPTTVSDSDTVPATSDTVSATGDTVPATSDTVPTVSDGDALAGRSDTVPTVSDSDTVPATSDSVSTVLVALETERESFLAKIQELTKQVQLLEARVRVLEGEDPCDTDEIKELKSHRCSDQFVVVSKNAEGAIELVGRTNVSLTPSGDTMVHSQFASNRHFMISLFRDALANIKEWDNYTLQYYYKGKWVQTNYIGDHVETDVYRLTHKVRGNVMYVIAPYT